jgi:hypothetical protein
MRLGLKTCEIVIMIITLSGRAGYNDDVVVLAIPNCDAVQYPQQAHPHYNEEDNTDIGRNGTSNSNGRMAHPTRTTRKATMLGNSAIEVDSHPSMMNRKSERKDARFCIRLSCARAQKETGVIMH